LERYTGRIEHDGDIAVLVNLTPRSLGVNGGGRRREGNDQSQLADTTNHEVSSGLSLD
jgi:hypothetical protein